ncbi:MAG: hypothetical protein OYH77_08865 [Pseudomonadota bacterium]|nr:hypothetical protein [Pseudomonadota bacterium]
MVIVGVGVVALILVVYLFIKLCSLWWLTHLVAAVIAVLATRLVVNRDADKAPIAWIPNKFLPLAIIGLVVVAYLLAKVLGWLFALLSLWRCSSWWFETHLVVATLVALATYVFLRRNDEGTFAHACAKHTKNATLSCAAYLKTKFNQLDTRKCAEQIKTATCRGLEYVKRQASAFSNFIKRVCKRKK